MSCHVTKIIVFSNFTDISTHKSNNNINDLFLSENKGWGEDYVLKLNVVLLLKYEQWIALIGVISAVNT